MIILITGATAGIGKCTAERLAQRGYQVFGTGRQPDPVAAYTMLPLNVDDDQSVAACVQSVIDQAGRLDVLVNNAGTDMLGAAEEASLDQVRALFETNVFGTIRMVNAVLPHLRENGGGKIINLSSSLGLIGAPMQGIYAASKHAIEGYSESLWYELQPFRIAVSVVQPAFFRTALAAQNTTFTAEQPAYAPMRTRLYPAWQQMVDHAPPPDAVARTIEQIIRSKQPRLRYPVGRDSHLIYWLRDWLPFRLKTWIIRKGFNL